MEDRNEVLHDLGPSDGKPGEWNDYIINVVYDCYAMGGLSYTIEFYLGGPNGNNATNFDRHNYVGHVYSFRGKLSTIEGSCSNCKRQAEAEALSCGQVPLTIHLLRHAKNNGPDHPIQDFTEIEEYLKLHLRWRVIKYGGKVLSEEMFKKRFTKTKISVLRDLGQVSPANLESNEVSEKEHEMDGNSRGLKATLSSVYSNYVLLPGVTDGKPGGLQISETPRDIPDASIEHNLKRRLPTRHFTTNDICVFRDLSCQSQAARGNGELERLAEGIKCSYTLPQSTRVS